MMGGALTAGQGYIQPVPAWRVTLDGADLTVKLAPRLISLSLSEKRGEATDELTLVLHDADGMLNLPPQGAVLTVAIGWERGTGVAVGLVPKGTFTVQDVEWGGPPDQVTITAKSADMRTTLQNRRNRVFHGATIGAIIAQIASDNGLADRCHPALAGNVVTSIEQANKSDMQFLRDLGRRYDAVATIKGGTILFAPIGATTTASGATIPTLTITRQSGDKATYKRSARENTQDGAEAQHFDQGSATRKTVGAGGSTRRRLKRVYASEGDAMAAASAENNRIARAAANFSLTLSYGDGRASTGMTATTTGFKTEIDARKWLIGNVEHTMGDGGFTTQLQLEVAAG
jgi:phage protein D